MSNIVPFESSSIPAFLAAQGFDLSNDLIVSGSGFPTVSIKGKVFTLKRGDEKTLITKPDSPDEPAASLEVVILRAGPEGNKLAKVYYEGGFTEGSEDKPLCYSNDGVKPSINAQQAQCATCAACPHNAWGSKITENGQKAKACNDSKRLAIAPAGQINDPMLLRVPAASLKALTQFGDTLAKRKVPYQAVIAKIGFDYTVAHPALTFKPVGFVDEATLREVLDMKDSDVVLRITGIAEEELRVPDEPFEQAPKPAAKPAEKPKAAAPKPAAKPAAEKPAPAPKPAAKPDPAPKVAVAVEGEDIEDADEDIDAALDSIDFDD